MNKKSESIIAQEISNIIFEKFEKQYVLYTVHDKVTHSCLAIKYNNKVFTQSCILLTIIQQVISELEISYGVYEYKKFINIIHQLLNITKENCIEQLEDEFIIYFPNLPPPVAYGANEFSA
jgi:hypothetical protein